MRLKAILVDDEINILRNLQLVLPWQEYDVEVVGMAQNGLQAIELVKLHQPHLVFCDIRMPVMDGIDFLRELRQFDQITEVIMLTGYQEFEYARTVLRYRVLDYVLKPIDYDALEQLFIEVAGSIRDRLTNLAQESQKKDKLTDLAYEKMLLDLIHGRTDTAKLSEWHEQFEILDQQCLMFVISGQEQDMYTVANALMEGLSKLFAEQPQIVLLQVEERYWTILAVGHFCHIEDRQLQATIEWLMLNLDLQTEGVNIAAYNHPLRVTDLQGGWQRLSKELSLGQATYRLLAYNPVGEVQQQEQFIWHDVDLLVQALKQMDRVKAREIVSLLEDRLRTFSSQSLQQVEMMMSAVLVYLIKELRKYDAISAESEWHILQQLHEYKQLKEMLIIIRQLVEETFTERMNKRPQASIGAAKEYIESHLASDIAAEEVASYLNISISYFSTLFKQHYGMNFIDYVTEARIERAKGLLTLSNKSISDIARTVGYLDRRYFNKVFLRKVGVLPSVYRERNKREMG